MCRLHLLAPAIFAGKFCIHEHFLEPQLLSQFSLLCILEGVCVSSRAMQQQCRQHVRPLPSPRFDVVAVTAGFDGALVEWGYSAEPISVHLDRLPDTGYVSISSDHIALMFGVAPLNLCILWHSLCSRLLLLLPVVPSFNVSCRIIWRIIGSALQRLYFCMIRGREHRLLSTQVTS